MDLLGKDADNILRLEGLHAQESRNILGWYSNAWRKGSTVNPGSQQVGGSRHRVSRPGSHQQQGCLQHWLVWPWLCLDKPWKVLSCSPLGTCPRVSQCPAWTHWSHCPDTISLSLCSCPRSGCCVPWQGKVAVPRLPSSAGPGRAQGRAQSKTNGHQPSYIPVAGSPQLPLV